VTGGEEEHGDPSPSRGDYTSMVRAALALYDEGLSAPEVLRACYGVTFPEEFFAVAEADPYALDLSVELTGQPWELAVPPDQGGPAAEPGLTGQSEQAIVALDPDLLPLVLLLDDYVVLGGTFGCYRLTELAAGRTTVFCIRVFDGHCGEAVRCADSLLDLLYDFHADLRRKLEREFGRPSNRGAGSVDRQDVDEARSIAESIERLRLRLTSRPPAP
jgi:hypothetical protein